MWDLKYDWNGKGQNGKSQRDRTWWSSSSLVADVVVPPFRQNDFKTPPPPRCLLLLLNDVVAEAPPPPLLDPLLLLDPIFGQMCVFWQTEWSVWVWLTVFCSLVFLLQCWMNLFLFRSTTTSTCWMSLTFYISFSLCLFGKTFSFFKKAWWGR